MAAKLTGLAPAVSDPPVYRCVCGCGAFASRGFPNGIWYAPGCRPPHLLFPWEPGYAPPVQPESPAESAASRQARLALSSGPSPA